MSTAEKKFAFGDMVNVEGRSEPWVFICQWVNESDGAVMANCVNEKGFDLDVDIGKLTLLREAK